MSRLLQLCLAATVFVATAAAQDTHFDFRAQAEAAIERRDDRAAREALEYALEILPDSPRYLQQLAGVCARLGDTEAALDYLRRLAALGVTAPVERDPAFAPLQGQPEFIKLLHALADNAAPRGEAEVIAELPGRTGIIEGLAFRRRTGDLFLGDVHHRAIWRRDYNGQVTRFTAEEEELLGVFGIALDLERDTLWAATCALPAMAGYLPEMQGQTALAEIDLSSGKLRRAIPVPSDGREHALSDLTVAEDGTVYATDSLAPIIWQLAPGGENLEKLVDDPAFHSLQGVVVHQRTAFVADFANGLFSVDLRTREIIPLFAPENATLVGLDGLVAVPGGLVAVQNGVEPQRVVLITLAPGLDSVTAVTVLASGQPYLSDLGLVTFVNDRPTFIAGVGWAGWDPARTPQPPAHTVRIFQAALP